MKYQHLTRIFLLCPLEKGSLTINSTKEIHYLSKVMRKRIGDQVLIFNNLNGEYLAEIISISNQKILLNLIEKTRDNEQEKEINLIFSPIKQARMMFLLEKATELGATKLIPIETQHSVVDKINLNKYQIYLKEAAEQCGRLSLPKIKNLTKLNSFIKEWDPQNIIILCNEKEENLSFNEYLKLNNLNQPINIMIGPEGGFSKEELKHITSLKFIKSTHLGPKILRAETAALTALAIANTFI